MSNANVIALIAVTFSALSTIVAIIACYISYLNSKPKIRIDIKQKDGACIYFCNVIPTGELESFVMVFMSISNHSSVGGTIADIYFVHDGKECHAQTVANNYEPRIPFNVEDNYREKLQRRVPLAVPPFSADIALFFFPDPPPMIKSETEVTFYAKVIGDKRRKVKVEKIKERKIEGVIITDISRDPYKVTFISKP